MWGNSTDGIVPIGLHAGTMEREIGVVDIRYSACQLGVCCFRSDVFMAGDEGCTDGGVVSLTPILPYLKLKLLRTQTTLEQYWLSVIGKGTYRSVLLLRNIPWLRFWREPVFGTY